MQSPTKLLASCRANVDAARQLVDDVPKDGCETDLDHLKLRSFVLLAHSVIEEYVEELALEVAKEARSKFKKEGKISKALVALIASRVLDEFKEKSARRVGSDMVRNIDIFSEEAFTTFKHAVSSNNGIQPNDLHGLFVPIGFDPSEVNGPLVQALAALGKRRGGVAHKFAIKQELTLSSFESDLNYLLRDLEIFDDEACKCLATEMTEGREVTGDTE